MLSFVNSENKLKNRISYNRYKEENKRGITQ